MLGSEIFLEDLSYLCGQTERQIYDRVMLPGKKDQWDLTAGKPLARRYVRQLIRPRPAGRRGASDVAP